MGTTSLGRDAQHFAPLRQIDENRLRSTGRVIVSGSWPVRHGSNTSVAPSSRTSTPGGLSFSAAMHAGRLPGRAISICLSKWRQTRARPTAPFRSAPFSDCVRVNHGRIPGRTHELVASSTACTETNRLSPRASKIARNWLSMRAPYATRATCMIPGTKTGGKWLRPRAASRLLSLPAFRDCRLASIFEGARRPHGRGP